MIKTYYDNWYDLEFSYEDVPLSTHNKKLFFQKISCTNSDSKKNILFLHGLTANSKVLDICYKNYMLSVLMLMQASLPGLWMSADMDVQKSGKIH